MSNRHNIVAMADKRTQNPIDPRISPRESRSRFDMKKLHRQKHLKDPFSGPILYFALGVILLTVVALAVHGMPEAEDDYGNIPYFQSEESALSSVPYQTEHDRRML